MPRSPHASDLARPPAAVTEATTAKRDERAFQRGLWLGVDQANLMGVELIAAILTWTAIGWVADRWLGTGPWLLVVGALIGNAAGIYLIWLRSERMEAAERAASASMVGQGSTRG